MLVCLAVCLYACLPVCVFVFLSACRSALSACRPPVRPSACLGVCLSVCYCSYSRLRPLKTGVRPAYRYCACLRTEKQRMDNSNIYSIPTSYSCSGPTEDISRQIYLRLCSYSRSWYTLSASKIMLPDGTRTIRMHACIMTSCTFPYVGSVYHAYAAQYTSHSGS